MPQHRRRSRVAAVLPALLVLLALVAAPVAAAAAKGDGGRHGHHGPTIAEARAMPLGTVVTKEGTVTTPSGVFASSFSDQGFAGVITQGPIVDGDFGHKFFMTTAPARSRCS